MVPAALTASNAVVYAERPPHRVPRPAPNEHIDPSDVGINQAGCNLSEEVRSGSKGMSRSRHRRLLKV